MKVLADATDRDRPSVLSEISWLCGVAFFSLNGAWAFIAPHSFFLAVAHWTPYNGHFLRDAGAFSLGIAAAMVVGHFRRSGFLAGLSGAATGAAFHAIAHVTYVGRGGRSSDPYLLSALAFVLMVGTVSVWRRPE